MLPVRAAKKIESSLALGCDPTFDDIVQIKDHTTVRKLRVTEAIATPITAVKYVELAIKVISGLNSLLNKSYKQINQHTC